MQLDGNPFEMATIVVAAACSLIRPIRRWIKHTPTCFTFQETALDFLNGTVVVPFLLLIGAVFSKDLLRAVLDTNKLFLAVGGFIGLVFVVRDYFTDK